MRKVIVAATQIKCTDNVDENISKAEKMVRDAAGQGANTTLMPVKQKKIRRLIILSWWQRNWV
jgi:hypothetical protein